MDGKGQISVELILILAFILLVVLVVAYYASDQSEQNNIATVTRLGATNATTAMGITTPGMLPVRVDAIQISGTQNITVSINLNYKNNLIQNTTLTGVYNSLTAQGYSPQKKSVSNIIQNLTLNTTRHNYNIMLA
nr:class III signal peptide-containing protein [uncultured Methanobacterium sp.]